MLALWAAITSALSFGMASLLMRVDTGFSVGPVAVTAVMRLPVTVTVTCTGPYRWLTAGPLTVFGVGAAVVGGAVGRGAVVGGRVARVVVTTGSVVGGGGIKVVTGRLVAGTVVLGGSGGRV